MLYLGDISNPHSPLESVVALFWVSLLGICPPSGNVSCPLITTQVVSEKLTQPGQGVPWGTLIRLLAEESSAGIVICKNV